MDIFSSPFLIFLLVGFVAQLADGALGMAYGTLSMTVLLSYGVPPALASAGVHTAQFFTTGISGLSHALFRNVHWKLCLTLAAAGIVGGILGALFLVNVDENLVRPWIALYLLVLGITILRRVKKGLGRLPRKQARQDYIRHHGFRWRLKELALGFSGGGLDAIGGGGWGPVVTSSLLASGEEPRYTVGSANLAEFFVKTAIAATFFTAVGLQISEIVLGLLIGGMLAAPLGALIVKRIRADFLMGAVGGLIIGLSLIQLYSALL